MSGSWLDRLRRENWRALGLLLAAFVALIQGVAGAVSGLEFSLLWRPLLLGVALGWGLAATQVSGRRALLLSLFIGAVLAIMAVGNLSAPLAALAFSLVNLGRQALIQGAWPATAPLLDAWQAVAGPAAVLMARSGQWLLALARGRPAFDPAATAVLWLLLYWGAAVWAGWAVRRRRQPLAATLPGLLLLAAMLASGGGSAFFLAPALALALILRATVTHRDLEESWQGEAITFPARAGRNVAWTASGVALALIAVGLAAPSPSLYRLIDYARDQAQVQREQEVARSLGLETPARAAATDAFAASRQGGLPARHLIGSGPELSDEVVMTITVEEPAELAPRLRYWRSLTYDRYLGHGWETRATATVNYEAGEVAGQLAEKEQQRLVRQEVRPVGSASQLLYAAGTPVTVDQPFQVAWRARLGETDSYSDLFAASRTAGGAAPYRVDSLVPVFDEEELRGAGGESSEWVAENYLALPDGVSDRVRALARDLTVAEPTPYDRALAIERYLRQFPYTLDLPAPPADREIADYFLFDLQTGYCDYYATSMVVLARAAGLPARLATGYVGGAYDEARRQYVVTADLAHSWPEIYFPEFGWIPFEPTAGRAVIARPATAMPAIEAEAGAALEPIMAARQRARAQLALQLAAGFLLLAATAALGWWLLGLWRLRLLAPAAAIGRLFEQLGRSGRRLDVRPEPGETPHEFAGRLSASVLALSQGQRGGSALATAPEAIAWLTSLYARSLFSPYRPEAKQQAQAIHTWSRLRRQLLWAALLRYGRRIAAVFTWKG